MVLLGTKGDNAHGVFISVSHLQDGLKKYELPDGSRASCCG